MEMNRTELIEFLENVKAGKIQLTSNIWKLENGSYYQLQAETWLLKLNPVFTDSDTLICYEDEIPEDFSGQIIAVTSPGKQRQVLKACDMLTDAEIELKVNELPTVGQVAENIVLLIKKMNDEK